MLAPDLINQPRWSRTHFITWCVLLGIILPWPGVCPAAETAPAKVIFLPHWIPQAQFAGYYFALERGIYQQHGLDVTVLDGDPRKPPGKLLASGEATFVSHFLSAALKLRDDGTPLVHLAQVTQRSALMLVAHKSHGIHSVRDLDGKKVSIWPDFAAQPTALFRKSNLSVRTIVQGPTINLFLRGGVDAASAMWYNEYHLLLNSGLNENEVTVFFYDQHNLNFPEDCILTLQETWRSNPDVCRRFVRASMEGWRAVLDHKTEALEIVMRRAEAAHTGTNLSHQRWMLDRMCELTQPIQAGVALGELSRTAYEDVVRELKNSRQIQQAPSFEEFYVQAHP